MRVKTSGNKIVENNRKEMGRCDWTENTMKPWHGLGTGEIQASSSLC